MPDNTNTPLFLPPGISEQKAEKVIRKYAPLVHLHAEEEHLPSKPENFRESCRFRMSLSGRDKGWNKTSGTWEKGDQHGSEYHDVRWDQIVEQSDDELVRNGRGPGDRNSNIRPRDDKNLYGDGSQRGLFMQRARHLHDEFSGIQTTPNNEIVAPVFIDTAYSDSHKTVRVLFWFFYELNHWKFMITHEGDWEHITLVFRAKDFEKEKDPMCIFFAQHNGGVPVGFGNIKKEEDTHPIIYVHKHGHPCHSHVDEKHRYTRTWKTWDSDWVYIPKADWRDFAGAWGEVGETKHTTGPLGPYFKRDNDKVPIKEKDGKVCVVLKS